MLGMLEQRIGELWREVLLVEEIGPSVSFFFAIGGNSLKTLKLLNRVNQAFGVQLSVRDFFFNRPTLEGMAASVEQVLTRMVGDLSDDEAATLLGPR